MSEHGSGPTHPPALIHKPLTELVHEVDYPWQCSVFESIEEAAMDLGESRWSAFRLVTLPLVFPGIISSLLICFIISLDDFVIAQFLTGANPTMPVYIYGLTRFVDALPLIMAR